MDLSEDQARADLHAFLNSNDPLLVYWHDCRRLLGKCGPWFADKDTTLPISLLATVAIKNDLQRMEAQCILLLPTGDLFKQAMREARSNPTAACAYNTLGAIQKLVAATMPGLLPGSREATLQEVRRWIGAAQQIKGLPPLPA